MSSQPDEKAAAEAPETQDLTKLPFQLRCAMVVAFMREHGVDFQGTPMDLGTYVALPRVRPVDLWAEQQ